MAINFKSHNNQIKKRNRRLQTNDLDKITPIYLHTIS